MYCFNFSVYETFTKKVYDFNLQIYESKYLGFQGTNFTAVLNKCYFILHFCKCFCNSIVYNFL